MSYQSCALSCVSLSSPLKGTKKGRVYKKTELLVFILCNTLELQNTGGYLFPSKSDGKKVRDVIKDISSIILCNGNALEKPEALKYTVCLI